MNKTFASILFALTLASAPTIEASADDKVSLLLGWVAQAESGGFYDAVVKGFYKKHGLDVTIRPGGPSLNTEQLLAAGAVDFIVGASSFDVLNFAQSGVPSIAVAGIFQKDPIVLIAHPDTGIKTMADMKGKPIAISSSSHTSFWPFLERKFGFSAAQIRPYNYQIEPFLVDKTLIMQAYVTSEPYMIETQGGFKPKIFLLADVAGYNSYATILETTTAMVRDKPGVVQRLVDASIEGWYSYLYGDPAAANVLIKKDNPDMTDGQIAYSYAKMKEYGIVDSGDAKRLGIGAMTDARWKSFYEATVATNLYPAGLDYKKGYTLQFVNKKHAMEAAK
jgi:NitT/TauT family transport system substrate-binding protein